MTKYLRQNDPICLSPKKWVKSNSRVILSGVAYIGATLSIPILYHPPVFLKWVGTYE
jgi:hypothetical protein